MGRKNANIAPEGCQGIGECQDLSEIGPNTISFFLIISEEDTKMGEVRIEDGIIKISDIDIQDPKAAQVLAEYPENRWAEVTRRAVKIGLGYLKGGAQD